MAAPASESALIYAFRHRREPTGAGSAAALLAHDQGLIPACTPSTSCSTNLSRQSNRELPCTRHLTLPMPASTTDAGGLTDLAAAALLFSSVVIAAAANAAHIPRARYASSFLSHPEAMSTERTHAHVGLSEVLGSPIIVDNRPGAGGATARNCREREARRLYAAGELHRQPYHRADHLSQAALRAGTRFCCGRASSPRAAREDREQRVPRENGQGIRRAAKADGGELNMGSSGNFSTATRRRDVRAEHRRQFLHIPYKGASAAIVELLGGQSMSCSTRSRPRSGISRGKLRALAVTSAKPSSELPDVRPCAKRVSRSKRAPSRRCWRRQKRRARSWPSLSAAVRKTLATKAAHDTFAKLGRTCLKASPSRPRPT